MPARPRKSTPLACLLTSLLKVQCFEILIISSVPFHLRSALQVSIDIHFNARLLSVCRKQVKKSMDSPRMLFLENSTHGG
jgi:hypothetical protein